MDTHKNIRYICFNKIISETTSCISHILYKDNLNLYHFNAIREDILNEIKSK
jgi:hypothetical protein